MAVRPGFGYCRVVVDGQVVTDHSHVTFTLALKWCDVVPPQILSQQS